MVTAKITSLEIGDDVKANANKRIDNIAKLYGPGLADEVNPQTGVLYKNSTGWKAIEPGDVCWEDINEDGIINFARS